MFDEYTIFWKFQEFRYLVYVESDEEIFGY